MTEDDPNLEALRSPDRPMPWLAAEDVRRRGTGRRRRRIGLRVGGAGAVMVAAVVIASVALTSSAPAHAPRTTQPQAVATSLRVGDRSGGAVELVATGGTQVAPSSSAEAVVARAEADFSVDLLRRLQGDTSKNVLVSASSLSNALAMLNCGARGPSQAQIAALLGPTGSTAQTVAQGWSTLVADWAKVAAADRITLSSANGVWLQHGAPLVGSFTAALAAYFASGVWQVNFQTDPASAVRDLNAWVSRQTHGNIPDLLTADQVKGMLLVLVNATYFNANWTVPFSESGDITFTTGSGAIKVVPSMSRVTTSDTFSDDTIVAARLLYGSGRFAALVIEPKKQSLAQYVDTLGTNGLTRVANQLRSDSVEISMPTLAVKSSMDLKPVLTSLGMTDAFDDLKADFTGISPDAGPLGFVAQKATLDVTLQGTTATAATAGGVSVASGLAMAAKTVTFDHPFLFLIRDTQTGAVLFSAEINDPTAH